jgi:c-di-GMP-binding flagellar brake protein YcgR
MNNRRKYPRVNVYVLVSYDCYNDEEELFDQKLGVILDVSLGGMLIETDDIIEANYVKIVFVNHENKILSIVGSVVHSRKAENGKVKTGLCFHGSDTENIKIVTNLIRTHHYGR